LDGKKNIRTNYSISTFCHYRNPKTIAEGKAVDVPSPLSASLIEAKRQRIILPNKREIGWKEKHKNK